MVNRALRVMGRRIAPPSFILFAVLFGIGIAIGIPELGTGRGIMAAFDVAALAFLVRATALFRHRADDIRAAARDNDANRTALLAITGIVMLVILMSVVKELGGMTSFLPRCAAVGTLALAWLFSNTVYALHYAHLYYTRESADEAAGGLDFPGDEKPLYVDFVYFGFTLGMTFQTSDVSVTTRAMRRVVIGHCLAAFVFNLGVVAFTINALGRV